MMSWTVSGSLPRWLFVEIASLPAVTLTEPPTLPRPTQDLTMSTMELTLEVMEPSAGTLTTPSFSDLDITNLDIFFSCLCANTSKVSHGGNIYKHSVRSFLLQDFNKKF